MKIVVKFNETTSKINVEFADLSSTMQVDFGEIYAMHDAEVYSGSYEVTPKAYSPVVLETSNKLMKKDLTVREIPYFSVSNPAGGNTVYIAKELEFE